MAAVLSCEIVDKLRYSPHLCSWYCMDMVGRNPFRNGLIIAVLR